MKTIKLISENNKNNIKSNLPAYKKVHMYTAQDLHSILGWTAVNAAVITFENTFVKKIFSYH